MLLVIWSGCLYERGSTPECHCDSNSCRMHDEKKCRGRKVKFRRKIRINMRGNRTQILQRHLWAEEAGRLIERRLGGWDGPGSQWSRRNLVSLIHSRHLHRPSAVNLCLAFVLIVPPRSCRICRIQYQSVCCRANKWSQHTSSPSRPSLTVVL